MFRNLFLILALCAAALPAAARDLQFRSGRIIGAEISTRRIRVTDADQFSLPPNAGTGVCAILTVELAPGRLLSIYDYTLERNGRKYQPAALQVGNGEFSFKKFELSNAKKDERYSLLFFVDSSVVNGSIVNFQLKANFPPLDPGVSVPFNNLGSDAFTTPTLFNKSGELK